MDPILLANLTPWLIAFVIGVIVFAVFFTHLQLNKLDPVIPQKYKKQTTTPMWSHTKTTKSPNQAISMEDFKVLIDGEGNLKLEIGEDVRLTIPAEVRHAILEKFIRAVELADAANPQNDPLNKVLVSAK